MRGADVPLPFEPMEIASVAEVGPGQLEVWHCADGRKLLRLRDGWTLKWYELTGDQVVWLAGQLSRS